ncbi:hypothetical protein OCK02_24290 [Rhizobium sp. TRM96647]|nr:MULTISPECIES: hypothetical protein [unclassified Rhizobium]MCV3739293.1 hypothetical protein [Rhizobium sp. TRM96647]MCV3760957.1 hypothetical protein [Rhizobium sp. TRM96650]
MQYRSRAEKEDEDGQQGGGEQSQHCLYRGNGKKAAVSGIRGDQQGPPAQAINDNACHEAKEQQCKAPLDHLVHCA